jgi:hypothetical protein
VTGFRSTCPDGGTCHHVCAISERCWRVRNAGPLSGVYPDDEWPPNRAGAVLSLASLTPDQQAALAQLCRDLEARFGAGTTPTDALDEWHRRVAAGYYRHARRLPRPHADYRGLVATLAILAAIAIAVAAWWP